MLKMERLFFWQTSRLIISILTYIERTITIIDGPIQQSEAFSIHILHHIIHMADHIPEKMASMAEHLLH